MILVINARGDRLGNDGRWYQHAPFGTVKGCVKVYKRFGAACNRARRVQGHVVEIPASTPDHKWVVDAAGHVLETVPCPEKPGYTQTIHHTLDEFVFFSAVPFSAAERAPYRTSSFFPGASMSSEQPSASPSSVRLDGQRAVQQVMNVLSDGRQRVMDWQQDFPEGLPELQHRSQFLLEAVASAQAEVLSGLTNLAAIMLGMHPQAQAENSTANLRLERYTASISLAGGNVVTNLLHAFCTEHYLVSLSAQGHPVPGDERARDQHGALLTLMLRDATKLTRQVYQDWMAVLAAAPSANGQPASPPEQP